MTAKSLANSQISTCCCSPRRAPSPANSGYPAWVHNLRAKPQAHVEVGTESFDVTARELPPAERGEVFGQITAAAPGFGEYQAKTSRVIPLFELHRV